jgi:hypothetical protein
MIASLLNILVILDAQGGPAEYAHGRHEPSQEPVPA